MLYPRIEKPKCYYLPFTSRDCKFTSDNCPPLLAYRETDLAVTSRKVAEKP